MAASALQVPLPLGQLRRMPLGLRLSLLIGLLMVLGMGVMSLVILFKQNELRHHQIEDFGGALAMQLAASAVEPLFTNDRMALELLTANFAALPRISAASIVADSGAVLARSGLVAEARPEHSSALPVLLQAPPGIMDFSSPIAFKGRAAGSALISVETGRHSQAFRHTLHTLLITCGAVTLVAIVLAWLISRYVSRPIAELLQFAASFGRGETPRPGVERRNDELGQLMSAINAMGQGLLQKKQVEALLGRFLARDVAEEVLAQLDTVSIGGERVDATVLFADIVGFTSLSEQLSPEAVGEFLNEYYEYFTVCSRFYQGTVDKFIGDCAMVVFGAPKADPEHRFHAVCCAVLIQKLVDRLNRQRAAAGQPAVLVRIGVNSGEMLAGVMGGRERMEYTVVGDSVNMASRLCGEAGGGQVVIEEALYAGLAREERILATPCRTLRLRGKTQPSTIYTVEDVAPEYRGAMDALVAEVLGAAVSDRSAA